MGEGELRMDGLSSRFLDAFEHARSYIDSGHLSCAVLGVASAEDVCSVWAADSEGDKPEMAGNSFAIASISKAVTGTAIARLFEEGLLEYDQPIASILPEFGLTPERRRITVRHILTHSTGLPARFAGACVEEGFQSDAVWRLLCADPLSPAPGTAMRYSSYTYQLLNRLAESVTGASFGEILAKRVFEPCGMRRTGFRPVKPWTPTIDHPVQEGADMEAYCEMEMSGSGLWTTVGDLLHLGQAYLNPGRLLSAETIELVTRAQEPLPVLGAEGRWSRRTLGWNREPQASFPDLPETGFYHGGATGTLLWIDPGADLVMVFLANHWGSGNDHAFEILRRLYG